MKKKSLRENLKFQLAHVDGSDVKTSGKKIHTFSITKLGKRRKTIMSEPIETIIIRAQQNFDVASGLNPIQIEIEDDRILIMLKKFKNVIYKITPLGLLCPATVTNNTQQIFITARELNGVKTSILNKKAFDLFTVIDLNKIDNWNEVKGQSFWTSVSFEDHKEINNNSHLCFPFVTRSFSDLISFRIFLQDDENKKIDFVSGEKKSAFLIFKLIYI